MSFVSEKINQEPIVDTVFAVVEKAKAAKAKYDDVVDATIGSLCDEQGQLVAYETVYRSLKGLDNRLLAKYATSFVGNPDFCEGVKEWVLQDDCHLASRVLATPGGTGSIFATLSATLSSGQTLLIPDIAWGSYALMAQMMNLDLVRYSLFKDNQFDIEGLCAHIHTIGQKQGKVVVIINDPCQNPTGYSMSLAEWQQLIDFVNAQSFEVVILNDIAYRDYVIRPDRHLSLFDGLKAHVAVVIAFSLSKSMTSYGLRCGAAIILHQQEAVVEQLKIVMEKQARATWSNINNGAMEMFVDVKDNHLTDYLTEKQAYVNLLKKRAESFVSQAEAVKLPLYPFVEGFFVTIALDNETRDRYHEALMARHIYTVKVNKGIRVALCSLPLAKIEGLPALMKEILTSCLEA